MTVLEVGAGIVVAAFGVLSLIKWTSTTFEAETPGERVLFTLWVTARVGLWFAVAGVFIGSAVVEDPGRATWYVLIPIVLAGIQLLAGVALGRSERGDDLPTPRPEA